MADIDQIIAGGAGASSRADFSGIAKIADAFYKSRDEAAKNDLRTALQDGVPTGPDGQPDFGAMAKTFFQKGDPATGVSLSNLALQQSKQKYSQDTDANVNPSPGAQQAPVLPPSVNRSGSTTVAPALGAGGQQPQGAPAQPQSNQSGHVGTLAQALTAQGVPNDQIGAASSSIARQLGLQDPNAQLNFDDPQIRNIVVPAIQQLKRAGIGQVQPQGQPQQAPQGAAPPQVAQAAPQPQAPPQQPQMAPQQPQPQAIPPQSGATDPRFVGLVPAGRSPDVQVHLLQRAIDSGNLPPEQVKSYQNAIDAIRKAAEPTAEEKSLLASRRTPGLDDYTAQQEATKAAAVADAKGYVEKYAAIDDAGTKAIQEIPKLQTALKLMDSPDFYSGIGNSKVLALKRVAVALGGDPDKAAPQEIVGKVIADSVLNGLGALKGLGPIRVAEMNLARTAAMSPDNTPQTNRFLANVAIRLQQRAVAVSDLAQKYKEENGNLDVGFDRQLRAIDKKSPVISADEVQRFQSIIDGKEKGTPSIASPAAPKFNSPADVHAAVAAGTLKKGQTFTDPNGVQRIVP